MTPVIWARSDRPGAAHLGAMTENAKASQSFKTRDLTAAEFWGLMLFIDGALAIAALVAR